VLDLATAQPVHQVAGHSGRVTQIVSLHCNEFISCSTDRSIKLWDIRTRNRPAQNFTGKILEERSLGPSTYKRCAASPVTAIAVGGGDNSLVISTSADGVVRLWDRRYDVNVPFSVTHGHSSRITSIAWNGVGEFHTASHDGTVRTWDSITGQNTHMLQAFDAEGITAMKMTNFRCAQHVTITPRGPVTFTDHDKLSDRTCIVATGWNGSVKCFVHDVQH
jgi:WD40 repeat protein